MSSPHPEPRTHGHLAASARPAALGLTWLLRAAILGSAAYQMATGDLLYGLFCVLAMVLSLVPAVLAHSARATLPLELELALLWLMVADITLGNVGGLYLKVPWFDKAIHLGNSILLGLVGFLAIYVARFVGRTRVHPVVDGIAILLVTLGLGALWELAEYAVDRLFARTSQGAPHMTALTDTMADLALDGLGGVLGAILGPMYMRWSRRSRRSIDVFARFVAARERLPAPDR